MSLHNSWIGSPRTGTGSSSIRRRTWPRRWSWRLANCWSTSSGLTEEQSRALSPEKRDAVGAELADVLLYLIQLASALGIDPIAAAQAKLKLNAQKYPVDLARGNSKKYDEL